MTNRQVLEIAMKQSAIESSCDWQDFNCHENKVVISKQDNNARKLPFARLWVLQSIWQLSMVVVPPLLHAVT